MADLIDLTASDDEDDPAAPLVAIGVSPRAARRALERCGGDVARAADDVLGGDRKRTRDDEALAVRLDAREKRAKRPNTETTDAALAARVAAEERAAREDTDEAAARALAAEGGGAGARLDALVAGGVIASWSAAGAPPAAGNARPALAKLLRARVGDAFSLPGPLVHHRQRDAWSCGYRCCLTLCAALRARDDAHARAAATMGGDVAAVQRSVERAWARGFDAVGARQLGNKLAGTRKWIGPVEICVALRAAGFRANTIGRAARTAGAREAAAAIARDVAAYFQRGGAFPAILCFGGHNRVVAGATADGRLVFLDPRWASVRLELAAAADLACKKGNYEVVLVEPGVARGRPKDPNRRA